MLRMMSARSVSSATPPAAVSPCRAARSWVAGLRPAGHHSTSAPLRWACPATAAPMLPARGLPPPAQRVADNRQGPLRPPQAASAHPRGAWAKRRLGTHQDRPLYRTHRTRAGTRTGARSRVLIARSTHNSKRSTRGDAVTGAPLAVRCAAPPQERAAQRLLLRVLSHAQKQKPPLSFPK